MVVVFACLTGIGILRKFFENPILRYLGLISFSMYLTQGMAIIAALKLSSIPLSYKWYVVIALSVTISSTAWVLIERPISKIRLNNDFLLVKIFPRA